MCIPREGIIHVITKTFFYQHEYLYVIHIRYIVKKTNKKKHLRILRLVKNGNIVVCYPGSVTKLAI